MTCKGHGTFKIPEDPAGKARYESAMRHVELAKQKGKSVEEIHDIFKRVMNGDGTHCGGKKKE
ncbi:MAG: hypothetical protein SPI25_00170 [Dialister sp.]|nr:hypothetical protein [Dialister sp.]